MQIWGNSPPRRAFGRLRGPLRPQWTTWRCWRSGIARGPALRVEVRVSALVARATTQQPPGSLSPQPALCLAPQASLPCYGEELQRRWAVVPEAACQSRHRLRNGARRHASHRRCALQACIDLTIDDPDEVVVTHVSKRPRLPAAAPVAPAPLPGERSRLLAGHWQVSVASSPLPRQPQQRTAVRLLMAWFARASV